MEANRNNIDSEITQIINKMANLKISGDNDDSVNEITESLKKLSISMTSIDEVEDLCNRIDRMTIEDEELKETVKMIVKWYSGSCGSKNVTYPNWGTVN